MKKLLLTLMLVVFSINFIKADETLYCTPTGAGSHNGSAFAHAFDVTELIHHLEFYSDLLLNPGTLTIYFSKGDYYEDLRLDAVMTPTLVASNNVTAIHLYGGFSGVDPIESLDERDLLYTPTIFHAGTNTPISIDMGSTAGNICVIDGIRFDSKDSNGCTTIVNNPALNLVAGSYIISQCIFNEYKTTNTLLFLEGVDAIFNVVNSVVSKSKAKHLVRTTSLLNFINTTIAYLSLYDDLIGPSSPNYHYQMANCILYNIGDWNNSEPVYFEIHNSIVEHYNSLWMVDYGYNYWSTDPLFTFHVYAPYSCLTASDASYNGNPSDITGLDVSTNNAFTGILFYDVANHERFGNMADTSHLDIGAYQHYSNNTYHFQPQSFPSPQRLKEHEQEEIKETTIKYNLFGQPVDETYHGIVIRNGQKVLQ